MKVHFQRINSKTVKICPRLKPVDERPIKGADMFPEIYCNVFLCARKKSGKSTVVYNIIKNCASPETTVIVFASTVNKDDTYYTIRKYCEAKGIPFVGYASLKDEGANKIEALIRALEHQAEMEMEESEDEKPKKKKQPCVLLDTDSDEEPRKRRAKYRVPEYILVFDDLSNELRDPYMRKLLKENRHYKAKVIISSQHPNDLLPEQLRQIDYWLVFKGMPEEKLEKIYSDADIAIPYELFRKIYKKATSKPYSFLYIDAKEDTFRVNFNTKVNIVEEE